MSDEDFKKNGLGSGRRDSLSHDSDSTPSHRSHHDDDDLSREVPSEKGSERSDSESSPVTTTRANKSLLDDSLEDKREANGVGKNLPTNADYLFGINLSSSDSDDERGDAIRKNRAGYEPVGGKSCRSNDSVHGIRMYLEEEKAPEKELPPAVMEVSIWRVTSLLYEGKVPKFQLGALVRRVSEDLLNFEHSIGL
ncbi:hypothetical protein KIN20_036596 [Parelaphostrongylus tenuis]|uniref:Uncharacterized protein n=1 Tax=Parelaphostrongylus tenuis TaxID=148309 RepID=A0AAD5RDD2_PARTN|nr:hypothetical protein KIN20_036596 [Parelaphostrongylus tenuis]